MECQKKSTKFRIWKRQLENRFFKKGEIVYGGVPGPSPYYMDKKTLDVSDGSREKLWKSLQVKPNPEKGYRPKVQTYRVKRDIKVGKGYALANPEYGKGGGRQFSSKIIVKF